MNVENSQRKVRPFETRSLGDFDVLQASFNHELAAKAAPAADHLLTPKVGLFHNGALHFQAAKCAQHAGIICKGDPVDVGTSDGHQRTLAP